jgi:hypothetical protein
MVFLARFKLNSSLEHAAQQLSVTSHASIDEGRMLAIDGVLNLAPVWHMIWIQILSGIAMFLRNANVIL